MSESRAPADEGIFAGGRADRDEQDATLPAAYLAVRDRSLWLTDVLEIEDYGLQPMPDASPAKWHLAHTTWFFETFLLKPFDPHWRSVDARYEYLFNSYYNSVGAQFPRAHRGDLSRPTVREVLAYRAAVDDAMSALLARRSEDDEFAARVVLGLHHEEQHQELLLTDLKYAFGHNPLLPVYAHARPAPARAAGVLGWREHVGGLVEIGRAPSPPGADRAAFEFDNETPRHRVYLEPFALADRCVTCGEYLDFMADGGYAAPTLWLSDGWAWLQDGGPRHPLYWREADGAWFEYTLAGERPVDRDAPLTHVSFYEADAYARWAKARLPREAEWEVVADRHGRREAGNFVETQWLHPVCSGSAGDDGPADLFGNQWEWTCSAYAPYPGFAPAAGALGEYNGKFMSNQVVLRGGSCVTPQAHVRASYRNFFYPPDRWQFTGVRLARDL
ncbi:MAG: ergothioneine biosynthesis protein EgtB [Pseudomonadales bacterium]|nr:ergothioneine biosynthesis protein EgtB [Pseudomonadales bacterium]